MKQMKKLKKKKKDEEKRKLCYNPGWGPRPKIDMSRPE